MKPVGSAVYIKRKRVDWRLVKWLCLGSVPAAFCGVLVARSFGKDLQDVVQIALGVALLLAVAGLVVRALLRMREHAGRRAGSRQMTGEPSKDLPRVVVRPIPTVILGAVGGLVVGMTSVGSGSLIIVVLLALYPKLRAGDLVGTDLVQAVPLVASAAFGHILFGDFQLNITGALLVGSIPGVFIGAQLSARAQGGFVRRALAIVLFASSLKLLHATYTQLIAGTAAAIFLGPLLWSALRVRFGLPALGRSERTPTQPAPAELEAGISRSAAAAFSHGGRSGEAAPDAE
jgi:uncharacterized membrane protein YfcA